MKYYYTPNLDTDSQITPDKNLGTPQADLVTSWPDKYETMEQIKWLEGEIRNIKKEHADTKKDIEDTKESVKQTTTFMIFVAGAIIIAFFLSATPIFLDYLFKNEQRYEKFLDKTSEFYSKEEIDNKIKVQKGGLEDFKNCIWQNGLSRCLR